MAVGRGPSRNDGGWEQPLVGVGRLVVVEQYQRRQRYPSLATVAAGGQSNGRLRRRTVLVDDHDEFIHDA